MIGEIVRPERHWSSAGATSARILVPLHPAVKTGAGAGQHELERFQIAVSPSSPVQDSMRYCFPRTAAHRFTEIFNREMNAPDGLCVRQTVEVKRCSSSGPERALDFGGRKSRPESQHGCRFLDREGGASSESEARLRLRLGNKVHTVATTGTMGYARAFRHAFDWQQRCQLR